MGFGRLLLQKSDELSVYNTKGIGLIKGLAVKSWPYWLGAVILGLIQILLLLTTGALWGITTIVGQWGMTLLDSLSLSNWIQNGTDLKQQWYSIFTAGPTWLNVGLILGALLSSLLASQWRYRPIKSKKYLVTALIGGFLMGYGARIVPGCNIGALVGNIGFMSMQGWVFGLFVFVGAYIGSRILVKYLLE